MKYTLLGLLVFLFLAAHQDFWFWRTPEPILFGFLPAGLWYHALYTLAAAGLLALLVKFAWPEHLEHVQAEKRPDADAGDR
ncbi:MAG: DUF3311 domain-containing protein [Bryobacteraceae bacterium]